LCAYLRTTNKIPIFAISKNNKKWGQHYKICNNVMKTYDIYFNDSSDSNNKGFASTLDYCMDYINTYNGTDESFFADYKGGTVSIVCNETGEAVYEVCVK